MKKIIVHFKKEEFERVKNAISILAKFSEIYAPHLDKANSIFSFRVDDENETTEAPQCTSRQYRPNTKLYYDDSQV